MIKETTQKRISRRQMLGMMASSAAGVALMAAAPQPALAPQAKEITLKLFSSDLGGGVLEWFEKDVTKAYAAKVPGTKIEYIVSDWGKINEQLLAAFASGDPPDLFEHGSAASGASWAASGQALPLDTYFSSLKTASDYYEVALKTAYYNGKLFSMPRFVQPTALIYRKDYFKEAGLDTEKPPKTWEDVREMSKKLTKMSGDKMSRAGYDLPTTSWGGIQMGWFPYLFQNGSSMLTEDMKAVAFDSPAGIEAMNFYHDLLWKDKVNVLGGIPTGEGSPNAVLAGVAAIGIADISILAQLKKNFSKIAPDLGVTLPTSKVKPGSMLGISRTFIAKASKNADAAWNFLMFLHTPEIFTARWKVGGQVPPLKSFLENPEVKSDPLFQSFLKCVEVGFQWPPVPKWNDIRAYFTKMSDAFLAQAGPVDQIVKDTAKEINAILKA